MGASNSDAIDRRFEPVVDYLTRFSGLPTCEGKNLSRYFKNGNGNAWENYAKRTAPIILQPQWLYAALPLCVKRAFCCEWASLAYKKEPDAAAWPPLAGYVMMTRPAPNAAAS